MNFFQKLQKSIYGPEFYQEIIEQPFSFSLKYFYLLVLSLAFVITLFLSLYILPLIHSFFNDVGPTLLDNYPDDLIVSIKNGQASSNQTEPYAIPIPVAFKKYQGEKTNMLVIDTQTPFSFDLFNSYDTYALLTRDMFVFSEKEGSLRAQSLVGTPDITISKALIISKWEMIKPYIVFLTPLVVVGLFLLFIIVGSALLVYLLFGALLVWAVAAIKHLPLGYKKAYQVGLHAMTFGMIFNAFLFFFFGYHILFLFTALLVLIAAINLQQPQEPTTHLKIPSVES